MSSDADSPGPPVEVLDRPSADQGDDGAGDDIRSPTGQLALWLLALVATLAALLSRAIEPALLGVWEGMDHVIYAVRLGAAGGSQLRAVGSFAAVIALTLATLRSSLPPYVRAFSVGVGLLTLLALALSAMAIPLPESSRLVVAGAASALALLAVATPARIFSLRAAALVIGAASISGLVRIAAISSVSYAPEGFTDAGAVGARVLATLGLGLDAATVVLAALVVATHPPRGRQSLRPRWGVVPLLALAPALFVVGAQLGGEPERTGLVVLFANIARLLQIHPEPYVPGMVRSAVEVARWTVAAVALATAPRGAPADGQRSRMFSAALVLALCSAGTVEVPLCAAALALAALTLALHPGPSLARDGVPGVFPGA